MSASISTDSCWWRRASARSANSVATMGSPAVATMGPVGTAGRALRDQLAVTEPAQRHPQPVGRGDDQRRDLALGIGTGRHRRTAGHPQRTQRVDLPATGLRDTAGPAGLSSPRGGLGVDRIGLTLPTAGLPVRAIDLDQLHPCRLQKSSQASPINPATFNPDPHQLPERAQPGQQGGVTSRVSRELPVPSSLPDASSAAAVWCLCACPPHR